MLRGQYVLAADRVRPTLNFTAWEKLSLEHVSVWSFCETATILQIQMGEVICRLRELVLKASKQLAIPYRQLRPWLLP